MAVWSYTNLKRNVPGVVLLIVMYAVIFSQAMNKWANDGSPIRSIDSIEATVKSVRLDHGRGIYVVAIENDGAVLIDDDRPHLLNSRANIERVTRDNGFVFYRFSSEPQNSSGRRWEHHTVSARSSLSIATITSTAPTLIDCSTSDGAVHGDFRLFS